MHDGSGWDFQTRIEIIDVFWRVWRPPFGDETVPRPTKPFFAPRAELRKQRVVTPLTTETAGSLGSQAWRQSNANPQLCRRFRLRDGRPVDGGFPGLRFAR